MDPDDPAGLRFGIEAEFALARPPGGFCDLPALGFAEAQRIVDRLPDHGDPDLTRGDLAIKNTRWYVEGDERFDGDGAFLRCVPKGLETRTPVRDGISATVRQLAEQTSLLAEAAAFDGFQLASVGCNPYRTAYDPDPPYNAWERAMRARRPEYRGSEVFMLTFGPDLNLSHPAWTAERVLDVGRKLTHYAPAMVPFSFSSPFAGGSRATAWSTRTVLRAGRRPAARVFLDGLAGPDGIAHLARVPAEVGRVEFKAFDALPDAAHYPALLALVAGIALDRSLTGRATVPDPAAHRRAAVEAFDRPEGRQAAAEVLAAAERALRGTAEAAFLDPLAAALAVRRTPAHEMIDVYERTGGIPLNLVAAPEDGA